MIVLNWVCVAALVAIVIGADFQARKEFKLEKFGARKLHFLLGTFWLSFIAALFNYWHYSSTFPNLFVIQVVFIVPFWIFSWVPGGLLGLVVGSFWIPPKMKVIGCGLSEHGTSVQKRAQGWNALVSRVQADPDSMFIFRMLVVGMVPWFVIASFAVCVLSLLKGINFSSTFS
jgi:hypothetical protein